MHDDQPRHRGIRSSCPPRTAGLLITFEGIEGSGKTTQCRRLARWLRAQGLDVVETREPGGTPLAERIRSVFLGGSNRQSAHEPITPQCEVALILACRAQHVRHVIQPAIERGGIVLCDRFSDSTLAYQGYGRQLDVAQLRLLDRFATGGIRPDLTLLFDVPVTMGLARRRKTVHQNRLDRESLAFHRRVRQGFLALAQEEPDRITVLNARRDPDALTQEATRRLARWLATGSPSRPAAPRKLNRVAVPGSRNA